MARPHDAACMLAAIQLSEDLAPEPAGTRVQILIREFLQPSACPGKASAPTITTRSRLKSSALCSWKDAAKSGHMPFGAVLADAEGKILAEAEYFRAENVYALGLMNQT